MLKNLTMSLKFICQEDRHTRHNLRALGYTRGYWAKNIYSLINNTAVLLTGTYNHIHNNLRHFDS